MTTRNVLGLALDNVSSQGQILNVALACCDIHWLFAGSSINLYYSQFLILGEALDAFLVFE